MTTNAELDWMVLRNEHSASDFSILNLTITTTKPSRSPVDLFRGGPAAGLYHVSPTLPGRDSEGLENIRQQVDVRR